MFSPPEERVAREGVQGYMTEERKLMQQMAREFAREEVLPIANELDPVQGDIPQELIDKMGDLGFFAIMIPEELGGLGLGCFEYCLAAEELAGAWMSVASLLARANTFSNALTDSGADTFADTCTEPLAHALHASRQCNFHQLSPTPMWNLSIHSTLWRRSKG